MRACTQINFVKIYAYMNFSVVCNKSGKYLLKSRVHLSERIAPKDKQVNSYKFLVKYYVLATIKQQSTVIYCSREMLQQ